MEYKRMTDGATAEALDAVAKLVDITRNDMKVLERILILGTNTEKPIMSRTMLLESKLEELTTVIAKLEAAIGHDNNLRVQCGNNKDERLKKLEKLAYLVTAAMTLVGAVIAYLLQYVDIAPK